MLNSVSQATSWCRTCCLLSAVAETSAAIGTNISAQTGPSPGPGSCTVQYEHSNPLVGDLKRHTHLSPLAAFLMLRAALARAPLGRSAPKMARAAPVAWMSSSRREECVSRLDRWKAQKNRSPLKVCGRMARARRSHLICFSWLRMHRTICMRDCDTEPPLLARLLSRSRRSRRASTSFTTHCGTRAWLWTIPSGTASTCAASSRLV